MKNNGLQEGELDINEAAVRDIIRYYTREAGVRSLERELSKICRKVVKEILEAESSSSKKAKDKDAKAEDATKKSAKTPKLPIVVNAENLNDYLGVRRYTYGKAESENKVGQVTGLAWTEVGGDLLTIEVADMPGKGQILRTGSLGRSEEHTSELQSRGHLVC